MSKDYVEERNARYWIKGTRVPLDSIVFAFLRGASPESIARSFPVSLEEVFGAIAYYLANHTGVDEYLETHNSEFAGMAQRRREANPLLHQKLDAARHDE
jgi:uncharacterized protein (DUF433 family)